MILAVCPNPSVDKFIRLPGLKAGGVNRSLGEQPFPGGKGVHVAAAITELGGASRLVGFWGGPTGQWVREECRKKGIDSFGPQTEGWTRTCLTVLSEDESADTEIIELGPALSEPEISSFFTGIREASGSVTAMSVSGSWPDGSPDHVYRELKEIAETAGIPLWADASGERLRQAVDAKPFGIHVNRSEIESLYGPVDDPAEAARRLLDHCTVAAVTDGANGLWLATPEGIWHASCRLDRIISTVGSGDCLLAGVIHAHASGGGSREMAILGTACGAANCIHPDLGMIRREDVDRLSGQVTHRKL